jgi:hypothetical protein
LWKCKRNVHPHELLLGWVSTAKPEVNYESGPDRNGEVVKPQVKFW